MKKGTHNYPTQTERHEAQVGRAAQLTRHEMIELVEIAVGPKLTGQVADGQAARAVDGKQVVVREVDHVILSSQRAGAAAQNQRDQAAQIPVLDAPVEGVLQDAMVNAGKVLAQIALQNVAIALQPVLACVQAAMRALTDAVAIVLAGAFPEWLDRLAQRAERIRFMRKEEKRLAQHREP